MNGATTEAPLVEERIQLKTYNAETLSAKDLKKFLGRPRIDFNSILAKVRHCRFASFAQIQVQKASLVLSEFL